MSSRPRGTQDIKRYLNEIPIQANSAVRPESKDWRDDVIDLDEGSFDHLLGGVSVPPVRKPRPKKRERRKPVHNVGRPNIESELVFSIIRQSHPNLFINEEAIDYMRALGEANGCYDYDSGVANYDIGAKSSIVRVDQLHITHLMNSDIKEIIFNAFSNGSGRISNAGAVSRKVQDFQLQYQEMSWQRIESRRIKEARKVARTDVGVCKDIIEKNNEDPFSGVFGIRSLNRALGRGNVVGFVFTESSKAFLQSEKLDTFEFLVKCLGIKPEPVTVARIEKRVPHVTIFRQGLSEAELINRSKGKRVFRLVEVKKSGVTLPEVFTTEELPKVKTVNP